MEQITLKQVDFAFESGNVRNLTIIRLPTKDWYFTFESDHPEACKTAVYSLQTQRGDLRVWKDPRNLVDFLLERYGVTTGSFYLLSE